MDPIDLLRALDKEGREYPLGLLESDLERDCEAFGSLLVNRLPSITGPFFGFQDCTFFALFRLPIRGEDSEQYLCITVSRFGKLVAIRGQALLSSSTLILIRDACSQFGFTFFEEDVLNEPYDGVFCFPDWWTRFFDYV